jgi:hypothetical protein
MQLLKDVNKKLESLYHALNYDTVLEKGSKRKYDKKEITVEANINDIALSIISLATSGNKEALLIIKEIKERKEDKK